MTNMTNQTLTEKVDKKLKRIEDEIIGLTMEMVGTVWGIEMASKSWTDKDMKFFNSKVTELRNKSLEKIRKIYLRKERTKGE